MDRDVYERLDPKVLGGLLGLIAHDLRNPLSALHSNVGFIGSMLPEENEDAREALSDALVSCEGLVAIIDNVELLSQALSGLRERAVEPFCPANVAAEVVAALTPIAHSHEVKLDLVARGPEATLQTHAHRDMYRRALANLVRNGIQYSTTGPVAVRVRDAGDRIQIVIADHGPRLAPELEQEAFSAAGQLQMKGKASGRYGRGLGLFCAAYAAQVAGASVELVEPPEGKVNALALTSPKA